QRVARREPRGFAAGVADRRQQTPPGLDGKLGWCEDLVADLAGVSRPRYHDVAFARDAHVSLTFDRRVHRFDDVARSRALHGQRGPVEDTTVERRGRRSGKPLENGLSVGGVRDDEALV